MLSWVKTPLYRLLRWSEKYAKTDMVHFFSANFWLNASRVLSIGTGMLLTVAFANLLSPETFGTYKYVIAAAGLVATFSMNGLTTALLRASAQRKFNVIPGVVRSAAFWSLPASLASFGISIYYFAQGNGDLGYAFLFIAVNNVLSGGIGVTKGVWYAAGEFKVGTIAGIPKIVVPFIVILLTILYTENVVFILAAYFFSNLALSIGGYYFMLWWFKVRASKEDLPETLKFGKQMTALGFFQLLSGQIDQLLLFHFVGAAPLAVYALAQGPVRELQNTVNNFLTILLPKIASKSESEVHQTLPLRIIQMSLVAGAIVLVYIAAAPFLFTYLFPKYKAAILISQILAVTTIFQSKNIIDTFFTAHGQVWNKSRIILTSQAIEFALFFILIPFFGLWGAVWATFLSEAVGAAVFIGVYLQIRHKELHKTRPTA